LTGLVFAAGVYIVFRILRRQQTNTDADDAAKILRQRYANGEIDEEEFERRRTRLSVPHQP
jgi:putative membrane protein